MIQRETLEHFKRKCFPKSSIISAFQEALFSEQVVLAEKP